MLPGLLEAAGEAAAPVAARRDALAQLAAAVPPGSGRNGLDWKALVADSVRPAAPDPADRLLSVATAANVLALANVVRM